MKNMEETQIQGNSAQPQPVAPVAPIVPEPQPVVTTPAAPLPTETRDRTREQFEKLLESNRRLHEQNELLRQQNEERRQMNQAFEPNRQPQRPANPNSVDPRDFIEIDPITGEKYINDQRLRTRLEEVTQKANRLEQVVQSYVKTAEEREIERQEKETYQAHPDLNPTSNNFDPAFNRNVRSILTDSFYNAEEYGGRPLTFKEAADFVRAQFPKPTAPSAQDAQAQAEAEARATAAQAQKEQGSAQAVSQPRGQAQISDDQELEDLRYRTRYLNDDWALARRIVNTDHVITDDDVS